MSRTYTRAEMEKARKDDIWRARRRQKLGCQTKISEGGRHMFSVDQRAFFQAVETEGRSVLTSDADGWWKDQARRNPQILTDPTHALNETSLNGMRNRFGKVTFKKVYGKEPQTIDLRTKKAS